MAKTTEPFTVPFTYQVPYLPRSCTEERKAHFASQVDLSLRIVEPDEAPVAFRVSLPKDKENDYSRHSFPPNKDGSPREVRWNDNRFWLEWGPLDDFVTLLKGTDSAFRTPFGDTLSRKAFRYVPAPPETSPKPGALYRQPRPSKSPQGIQTVESVKAIEGKIKSMEDDGGASMTARLRAIADDCMVVDGRVFEMTSEPVLRLDRDWGGITLEPGVDVNVSLTYGRGWGSGSTTYRLDHLAEVDALALKAKYRDEKKPTPAPYVEILMPWLVMADPDGGRCLKAVRRLEKEFREIVKDLPRNWSGPVAAFGRLAANAPRLATPALASAIQAISALELPDAAGIQEAERLGTRRGRGSETRKMLEKLPELSAMAASIAAEARRLATHYDTLPGRLDPSVCSFEEKVNERSSDRLRLRQARAMEDFRRAARMLGRDMEGLVAEVKSDPDMDIVLVESSGMDDRAGRDMRLVCVHVVDLSTGHVRDRAGDGDEPRVSALLDQHLDEAWPGRRPTPETALGGP